MRKSGKRDGPGSEISVEPLWRHEAVVLAEVGLRRLAVCFT